MRTWQTRLTRCRRLENNTYEWSENLYLVQGLRTEKQWFLVKILFVSDKRLVHDMKYTDRINSTHEVFGQWFPLRLPLVSSATHDRPSSSCGHLLSRLPLRRLTSSTPRPPLTINLVHAVAAATHAINLIHAAAAAAATHD